LAVAVIVGGSVAAHVRVKGQQFTPTTAPAQNWISIASSADGTKLAAAGNYGYLYTSTDSGSNWVVSSTTTNGPEPQRPWTSLAVSADGSKLLAVANFSPVFVSTNFGQSWSANGPAQVWSAVACSSDASKIAVADGNMGLIYTSADGGVTWSPTSSPNKRWRCAASSADGARLVAGSDYGSNFSDLPIIYTSKDSGTTWNPTTAPNQTWQCVASSADGTKLAAGVFGGLIYLSTDSGTTWNPANVPNLHWDGIACSLDGKRLVAVAWEGQIYLSVDSGQTWTPANAPNAQWQSVACSSDGTKVLGAIWNQTTGQVGIYAAQLPPDLNILRTQAGPVLSWSSTLSGFTVQERTDLSNGSWTDLGVMPQTSNGNNQVSLSGTVGSHFYRLIHH
jgi:photosystem II stability/assembly factor-like uncharacterized protein